MAANRKAKVAYLGSPWSDFNDFGVYSRVFKVSELIALVFKMIVHELALVKWQDDGWRF